MKPWPWLGNADATTQRRADLWRLLGPRSTFATPPTGMQTSTRETAFAYVENWVLSLNLFVPGLRNEFTAAEISSLIAPRPHLSLVGRDDPLTPPAGVQSINAALSAVYASLEKPQHWQQEIFDCGHQETVEMRAVALRFVEKYG